MPWRANNRQRLPLIRRLRMATTISFSVKSGCLAIRANSQSACSSSGEMLPPVGLAATLPVSCQRCSHFTAELELTSMHSAASRRDAPAITASSRRRRKSKEQGFGIDRLPRINAVRFAYPRKVEIPDSTQPKQALARRGQTQCAVARAERDDGLHRALAERPGADMTPCDAS